MEFLLLFQFLLVQDFFNGGGTGSLTDSAQDDGITEQ